MAVKKIVDYSIESPYATTGIYKLGLDIIEHKPIPRFATDELYEITTKYHLNPQRLAYDLYGTTKLWWVFSARNPSTLKDPLFDFNTGTKIFLPKQQTIQQALGI